jgi:hypothetical protein
LEAVLCQTARFLDEEFGPPTLGQLQIDPFAEFDRTPATKVPLHFDGVAILRVGTLVADRCTDW